MQFHFWVFARSPFGTPGLLSLTLNLVPLGSLRDAAGKWKRFSSTDTTGAYVDIYLNPDKSPRQIRTEIQCKKLLQLLQQRYPGTAWRAHRAKDETHSNAMPIVRIDVKGQADPTILEWNENAFELASFRNINRGDVLTSFQALFADTASATWRV